MNKKELVKEIATKTNMTNKAVSNIITAAVDTVESVVANGEKITVVGFGSFSRKDKAARNGRNPHNGQLFKIEAKKYPIFSAGKRFKESVNK